MSGTARSYSIAEGENKISRGGKGLRRAPSPTPTAQVQPLLQGSPEVLGNDAAQHQHSSASPCVCGGKPVPAAPSPRSKRSRASPRTDGKLFEPRGCAIYNVCKWSRELGNSAAEAYLPKGGQKESAGGEREGAMQSASDETQRGHSSLVVPARLMGVISTTVIVPIWPPRSAHPSRGICSCTQQWSKSQKLRGSIALVGRGSLQLLVICGDVRNTYFPGTRAKSSLLCATRVRQHIISFLVPLSSGVSGQERKTNKHNQPNKKSPQTNKQTPCQHDLSKWNST